MRRKGITYDTGVFPAGRNSRPGFDSGQVRREMDVIARSLRCDAVRVTGGDLDRLSTAARYAADAGLEVWFSPQPCELAPEQMRVLFNDASRRAQDLRDSSRTEVALVLGCGPALAYLAAYAAPGFKLVCPGDSQGHQATTCISAYPCAPGEKMIIITVPCAAAYMNEAHNSWAVQDGGTIDPYGYCH